jgi:hypothetical protein
MRPVQFGATAKFSVHSSLPGDGIPEPFTDIGPAQTAFKDEFFPSVMKIPHRLQEADGARVRADEQHAVVIIDSEGARTEIKTLHNGTRIVPFPAIFQNVLSDWRCYFDRLAENMKVWESQLLSKEERVDVSLNASKKIASQLTEGLAEGPVQLLGDPAEIRRKLDEERQQSGYNSPELTLDVKVGNEEYSITRRQDRSSIWFYEITPKAHPEHTLIAEFNTDPAEAKLRGPIWSLTYKNENDYEIDFEQLHRKLSDQSRETMLSYGPMYTEKNRQAHRERTAKAEKESKQLWNELLSPMSKVLIALDQQTRHYNGRVDTYDRNLHQPVRI